MIVSSTILGISWGVTRPYDMYAPDGNNNCPRQTPRRQAGSPNTHEHDSSISVASEVIDVEDPYLSTLTARNGFYLSDPSTSLCIPDLVRSFDLLERIIVQTSQ